jgi:hypothetical protein
MLSAFSSFTLCEASECRVHILLCEAIEGMECVSVCEATECREHVLIFEPSEYRDNVLICEASENEVFRAPLSSVMAFILKNYYHVMSQLSENLNSFHI